MGHLSRPVLVPVPYVWHPWWKNASYVQWPISLRKLWMDSRYRLWRSLVRSQLYLWLYFFKYMCQQTIKWVLRCVCVCECCAVTPFWGIYKAGESLLGKSLLAPKCTCRTSLNKQMGTCVSVCACVCLCVPTNPWGDVDRHKYPG